MTTKTNLKAGGGWSNHNETLVRDSQGANLKTKTNLRAGATKYNDIMLKRGISVKTDMRAGEDKRPTENVAFYYSRI